MGIASLPIACSHLRGNDLCCEMHGICAPAREGITLGPTACPSFHRAYRKGEIRRADKPKLSINELADKKSRCQKLREAGLPCNEFSPSPKSEWLKPTHVVNVQLPDHFNASIIEFDGKILMASRLGFLGKIFLSELNENYQPIWSWELNLVAEGSYRGVEDPRLFVYRGALHVAFTGYEKDGWKKSSQLFAKLNDDLTVSVTTIPDYSRRDQWEKNWQFFEYNEKLYSVYSINPHVILEHDGHETSMVSSTVCPFRIGNFYLRGGAPPVRIGDEFYHWFHTVEPLPDKGANYGFGLYTFEAKPPFAIKRKCNRVLFSTKDKMAHNPFFPKDPWQHLVVFPCGAMLKDNQWVISYGWQDRECRIAMFNRLDVEGAIS